MTHYISMPKRDEFYGVVKSMKFRISFLCSDVFLNFSKIFITERCKRHQWVCFETANLNDMII